MSFQAAVSKLSTPTKELVVAVTENGTRHIGETEKDQTEVAEWIEKAGQADVASEANIQSLNSTLLPRTYLVSNYLTAADVAIYGALHPHFSKLQPPQYHGVPSLTRFFDHIQHSDVVRASAAALSPSFDLVAFDLENAPKLERKAEPSKKKEKKPAAVAEAEKPAAAAAPAEQATKKEKKEKKKDAAAEDAGKKKAAGGGKAPAADEGEPVPSMIDLRVGRIVDIMKHPDADGLYVEQIDIGEETGPRTVVSGLVNYIPIEDMREKFLVAVCNLKPATMRGVKSFAMVLCATSKEGKEGGIELIQPPPNAKPGDRVYFEGEYENGTPLPQLNPKKKIFETIQPGFITLESREAAWVNPTTKSVHRIRTKDGVCVAPTLVGASLS
ncbi:putative nucleic acid-binding protein [Lyophyllum shimeji]|uniref:Nucleic acid-binding protein n=1 Tax=Lyophyllum shimeji TaxID=47721 RepID=A0A9P3UKV3_LYOSH|nr:putative nucleic acid-binding protein [Lyophyllum shimeji]